MKKKVGILTAVIACAVCFAVGVSAAGVVRLIQAELRPDFEIVIDGKTQSFKTADGEVVYPILYDGTTYLPVRAIGEMMGKTVYWYQDEKRIELKDSIVTDADVIVTDGKEASKTDKNTSAVSGSVTLDEAKALALEKASLSENEVTFTEAKREKDDGAEKYEIEFRSGNVKYSAEIDANDGSFISWEVEDKKAAVSASGSVTLDEAKAIALRKASLSENEVTFTEAKLDRDDGVENYEIEFVKDGIEYSADIRVSDGAILSWKVEKNFVR